VADSRQFVNDRRLVVVGTLNLREWTLREWTMRHDVAGVENAGVDNAAPCGKGGQCGSGQCRSGEMPVKMYNIVMTGKESMAY